jgi:NAD(P) transhydrogenase subunit alpha
MVNAMRPGSVIVDLAAENGGNCALTRPGQVVVHQGVTIVGYVDLPSRLAPLASHMYGSNLAHLLGDMGGAEQWRVNLDDQVVRAALVLKNGELLWPPPKIEPPVPVVKPAASAVVAVAAKATKKKAKGSGGTVGLIVGALLLGALGMVAPKEFLSHFTVFVLACFVGWQIIWNVTPALHTPLMSVTNAISGIIVVGGLLQLSSEFTGPVMLIGATAVLLASINIAGGFLVTQRMLRMFHR